MNTLRSRIFATGLSLFSTSMAGLFPASGYAQAPAPSEEEEVEELERFVVTGSYIPTTELAFSAGVTPVVRIDRKVIDESGMSTTSELLQRITVSNAGAVPISNNATGFTPSATSISLRGLGPEATLVLINGRRVAPFPVGTGGSTAFVDLNSIPLTAVDTIEVLKDGASALYGADAVAGVVNIKMRRGMDGTEAFVSYGNTTDKDSSETIASLITGAQTNRTNVLIGFNYYKRESINNPDRDYSAVPPFLSSNSSPLNLQITRDAALEAGVPASSLPVDEEGAPLDSFFAHSGADTGNTGLRPPTEYTYTEGRDSVFNFNEFSMSYPERKNIGVFAFGERKIFGTENIKVYIDANYQNAETENQLAPSATGNFSGTGTELVIPARTPNPLPLPDGRPRAAAEGAFNPFNPFNVDITGGTRARLAEFGNRIFRNETDAFLLTFGVRGENIMEKWNFDTGFSYSEIQDTARNTLVSSSRFNRLVNAADPLFDPTSSEYLGTTEPYNPFGYFRNPIPNNSLLVDYAKIDTKDVNTSKIAQYSFVVSTTELFALPAGDVGFAFGGDVRHERLDQFPDSFGLTGDLIGSSPNAITRGQRKIGGVFAETKLPLLQGAPGAHSLNFDAAVRYESFMTSHRHTTVPKFGLRWQPLDESLTIRATWSKGYREPSLFELYATPTAGLEPITHPLLGTREPEQDTTVAGNRLLDAEKTEYLNVGVVWSPKPAMFKGLTLSVDYWDIDRKGTVDSNSQDTVNRFFGVTPAGNPAPGGLLPGESVDLFPDGTIRVVNSVFFNVGQTKADGFDFAGSYVFTTENAGRFELSTAWTWLRSYKIAQTPTEPLIERVGTDSTALFPTEAGSADGAYLEWKGRVNLEWAYKGFTVFVSASYTDGFADYDLDGNLFEVDDTWITDAQVSYNFRSLFAPWLSDTKVTIGARNLFDVDPPYVAGGGNNSTGYPGFLYTSENQFVYVSLSRKF